ncbi:MULTISPECIES: XisH family protein [unclassified Moorena]|uniref:XisH family protein n=1 Tax=unclassified Moorena TaxID=2683338 RepID=UPI0013CADDBC|nr:MULTISPECIES: XisH family protein [unclassified Moorena]NEO17935.1 fatty-acid synthase [Moorena sp. SIO4A5]NEP27166.1 fatty-acid synthase [Moorena sp. SIO3I6]NEQ56299.1 fatty-acid synthase [Moorena sp. SIO4A1]
MPAKDLYHDTVKTALIKDGWTITDDPLIIKIGTRNALVDLGAEKLIAAERGATKIAVEVKTFISPSPINDLEKAWGQFFLYSRILKKRDPNRQIYLAVARKIFETLFEEEAGQILLEEPGFRLLVFDVNIEEIIEWKPPINV